MPSNAPKLPADWKLPGTDLDIAFVKEIFAIWERLSPDKRTIAMAKMEQMVKDQGP